MSRYGTDYGSRKRLARARDLQCSEWLHGSYDPRVRRTPTSTPTPPRHGPPLPAHLQAERDAAAEERRDAAIDRAVANLEELFGAGSVMVCKSEKG